MFSKHRFELGVATSHGCEGWGQFIVLSRAMDGYNLQERFPYKIGLQFEERGKNKNIEAKGKTIKVVVRRV